MNQLRKLSVFKVCKGVLRAIQITPTPKIFISRAGFDFYVYKNTNAEYAIIESMTGQTVGYISKNKEEVIRIAHECFEDISDDSIRTHLYKSIEKHGFVEGYHMNHIPLKVQQNGKIANSFIEGYQKHIERIKLIEPEPFLMDWGNKYPNKPLQTIITHRDILGLTILKENQFDCLWQDEVKTLNDRSKFLIDYLEPDFKEHDSVICNGKKGKILEVIDYDWYNDTFWYVVDFNGEVRECVGNLCSKILTNKAI